MKKIFLFTAFSVSASLFSQIFVPAYQARVNQITQANINTYLTEFAGFGAKTTGSAANSNAFNWLKNKYLSFGYDNSQITENAFTYNGNTTKNLILTKTGTVYPNTFVIVCGHYDTLAGPGVNDNGSGTSIILEMARILKNVPTEYSIKFINFSGEEQGLLGSKNYVNTVVNSTNPKMNIKVVFNIDEVGGIAGQTNNIITCERDTNNSPSTNNTASNAVTQELMTCVSLYSPLQPNLSYAYSSDYMPFQSNGEIITGFYEYNVSNYPHSANDTYANMDPVYVYNVAKAALGATQHFATATLQNLGFQDCPPEKMVASLKIYPNPTTDFLNIEMLNDNFLDYTFTLSDLNGKILVKEDNVKRADLSKFPAGIYFATITVGDQKITKKLIIK